MGDKSAIEWTDATWTPIRGTGADQWICQKVSPGCDRCYASELNGNPIFNHKANPLNGPFDFAYPPAGPKRVWASTPGLSIDIPPGDFVPRFAELDERILQQPLHWSKPRKVFVCSMTDLFGEWVPDEWIDQVFAVMALAPQHTFQVLTKRAKRMKVYMDRPGLYARILDIADKVYPNLRRDFILNYPLSNVWLGVTVESQEYVWRLNYLVDTPAAVRFVSFEPLLGRIDAQHLLYPHCSDCGGPEPRAIDWVITGGESGPHHRPFDPEWAEHIRHQCAARPGRDDAIAFLHKQNGGRTSKSKGRELLGKVYDGYPSVSSSNRGSSDA